MGKRGETAGQEMAARKRKSTDDATGAAICDDVHDDIFARLPTRAAVASMLLSKHHHRLIRSSEFRSLHFRLSPPAPLPRPHIAYVVTAAIWRNYARQQPTDRYHTFHIAGAGLNSDSPMRILADKRHRYVNTCNGVVLLACPTTCVLWNPAVAEDEMEVTIPTMNTSHYQRQPRLYGDQGDYRIAVLGLGYGRRTKAYKLLLLLWEQLGEFQEPSNPIVANPKELLVYTLGAVVTEQPRRVNCFLSQGLHREISHESLYINDTIYVLFDKSEILAFNVDQETVTRIDMPGSNSSFPFPDEISLELIQMYDRPCLVKNDHSKMTMWLLTEDHKWERRCAFRVGGCFSHSPRKVVWNCGRALVLYLYNSNCRKSMLFSYEVATKKVLREKLLHNLTLERPDYALSWGYKPTLVSPRSIVGELSQADVGRRFNRAVDPTEVLEPVSVADRKIKQTTTQNTILFMESLIPIMKKLSKTQDTV